eukprot:4163076-Alexandrium_andersonii.AAC.1
MVGNRLKLLQAVWGHGYTCLKPFRILAGRHVRLLDSMPCFLCLGWTRLSNRGLGPTSSNGIGHSGTAG